MNGGNWVPISKALLSELPKDRAFTRLEAMLSLSVDYDQGKQVTVNGYASLWRWSRGRVDRFLGEIGASIEYPETTGQKQNQRGQIMIQISSRSRADNGQIKIIDSKCLPSVTDRKRTEDGQITDRSQCTTKDPNPNPLKDSSDFALFFEKLWAAYPRKDGKKSAQRHFSATVKNESDKERINLALGSYLDHIEREGVQPRFVKKGETWFNNWQDWIPEEESNAA
ncbi:MAG: hypothetical protein ACD_55C00120G0002 [uncultured bacterium]|uniref:Uncharacterized protein n=1 Tax=Citrifermentans bemidjiense (strain ATCC BAA-1014 / DSM 16622 / JCM 12645 / Bem) TaxID=404380 RepID=B5EC30_CITBB|nr:hypothetical protein Gbem_3493 [Citrifermentans bemidjiense Bem]EKD59183.1 MAG: hypothetical protein ACD_55C00120G0002 [uncultured bacterium]